MNLYSLSLRKNKYKIDQISVFGEYLSQKNVTAKYLVTKESESLGDG